MHQVELLLAARSCGSPGLERCSLNDWLQTFDSPSEERFKLLFFLEMLFLLARELQLLAVRGFDQRLSGYHGGYYLGGYYLGRGGPAVAVERSDRFCAWRSLLLAEMKQFHGQ